MAEQLKLWACRDCATVCAGKYLRGVRTCPTCNKPLVPLGFVRIQDDVDPD